MGQSNLRSVREYQVVLELPSAVFQSMAGITGLEVPLVMARTTLVCVRKAQAV